MSNVITSRDNSKIKHLGRLKQRKYREEYAQAIVEGYRAIRQLIDHGSEPRMLFVDEAQNNAEFESLCRAYPDRAYLVKHTVFEGLSDTINSQGILAVFEKPIFDMEKLFAVESARLLLLDRIQDPGNLGTLLRTADAAGFDAVLYTKGTTDIFSDKVIRSAMSTGFYLPTFLADEEMIRRFKKSGFTIVGTALDERAEHYGTISYGKKYILILGNEANGVSAELLALADEQAYIPIYGKAESLNVAIAGGILMYKSIESMVE